MDFFVDLNEEAKEKLAQLPELKKIKLALLLKDVTEKYIEVETSEIAKRKARHDFAKYIRPE